MINNSQGNMLQLKCSYPITTGYEYFNIAEAWEKKVLKPTIWRWDISLKTKWIKHSKKSGKQKHTMEENNKSLNPSKNKRTVEGND